MTLRNVEPEGPTTMDGYWPQHCADCIDEGYEYDHAPDDCPRDTPCCGARWDDDIAGRCPACGEAC